MNSTKSLVIVGALALGWAGVAQAQTVFGGIDTWTTQGDGSSFIDFSQEPIPAGFFCQGSRAYTGTVVWRGVTVATDPQVAADTIVERLDDATFDRLGRATTRLKVRALSLESVAPIRTECGSYNVRTSLAGGQPTTRMQIFLEGQNGGRYLAPLALNVRLTFTPADRKAGRSLELTRTVRLGADPRARWTLDSSKSSRSDSTIVVDTDGDGLPETPLSRSSNFAAGGSAGWDKGGASSCQYEQSCHASDGCEHCVQYCPCGDFPITMYGGPCDNPW